MKVLAFFFLVMCDPAFAAEESVKLPEIEVAGRIYKNATISLKSPTEAVIRHEDGTKSCAPNLLPKDLLARIGYDSAAAAQALKIEADRKQAQEKQKQIAAIKPIKLWVDSNTPEGLIVGNFIEVETGGGIIHTSGSRTGNGGGAVHIKPKITWERSDQMAFIPHTNQTRNITTDSEFEARVLSDGTIRLDGFDVVTKYRLLKIEPAKHSK